jgi:AcrR family transcriptional regulator
MTEIQNTLDVKERILQVSRELFIKNGYDGTSVRDIAAASGTNVAHIKYYFQSKYKLFEIIFEEAFNILIQRVFSIIQSDMPFFELIEAWINAYYEILPEYPQIPIFILNEINHGNHNQDSLIKLAKKQNPLEKFSIFTRRLDEEMKKGTIKETSVVDLGLNVVSLCVFPFMLGKFAARVSGISMDEYYAIMEKHKLYVIQFILNALKP